jgi:hypothetical protein
MSKDTNLRPASLDMVAVAMGRLTLSSLPSTTSSTPGSMAVTSSSSSSFDTPSRVSSTTELSTPTNQPVVANYEAIGLSPGSFLKSFDEVQAKIDEDGILDREEFKELMSILVFRCIYFLYGKGYAWTEDDPKERCNKIHGIVNEPGALSRLCSIACPTAGQLPMTKVWAFALYSRVALTAEHLLEKQDSQGGFPREPFIRLQLSNNCYLAAACVMVSLQLQKDQPEDPEACKPLDVAQMGRRYAIDSDENLERRVLGDKGMSAKRFASALVGVKGDDSGWSTVHFAIGKNVLVQADSVADSVATGKYGLVTNFRVPEPFKRAAENELKELRDARNRKDNAPKPIKKNANKNTDQLPLRYLKFDGNSIDTVGEVVEVPYHKKFDNKLGQLRQRWEEQSTDIQAKNTERDEKLERSIPRQWQKNPSPTPKSNEPTPGSDGSSGMHAMVLLGTYSEYKREARKLKWRVHRYFVLLNPWRSAPLVVVSPEYLEACEARVSFLIAKLGKSLPHTLERDDRLLGETSFLDGGDEIDETLDYLDEFDDDGDY